MNVSRQLALFTLSFFLCGLSCPGAKEAGWRPEEGAELFGRPAPELSQLHWLNSPPLTLAKLSGKVVLIRFWLIDCPYCQRTAPALNYLFDTYGKSGLVIIGIHHPKSKTAENEELVREGVERLKFKFPVAMDNTWANVNAYWLSAKKRKYTSASFLIDKRGTIRWVHPGGDIILERESCQKPGPFPSLEQAIKDLLAEQ